MAFDQERMGPELSHRVVLEDREQLSVSGVEEVARFDDSAILLTTNLGELEIQGEGLHIETLSLDGGELTVVGTIQSLCYEDETPAVSGGLLRRLLGG